MNYDLLTYDKINEFLTDLLLITFKIQNNDKIIDDIFSLYKEKCLDNYKKYFIFQWKPIIKSGVLNYSYTTITQRSNSFIENYNRRIKNELCKP